MAVLRMARPTVRANTRNGQYRQAIPADVRAILDKLPAAYRPRGWGKTEITLTLGTADGRQMAAEHARIAAEVQARFAKLRAGPIRLSHRDAVALSKAAYEGFASGAEADPGPASLWRGAQQMIADAKAGRGLTIETVGERRQRALEAHFGAWADALLANQCLVTDPASRWRLVEALADALNDAAAKSERNAGGDYTPDPAAGRFPPWVDPRSTERASEGRAALTIREMFDQWRKHPEQAEIAAHTVSRYEGALMALAAFLKNPDARMVTGEDVSRYVEARMSDPAKPLQPRVVRDVHKAAISSVFKWAKAKGMVTSNPADGIMIRVPRAKRLRAKETTTEETRNIVDACLAISPHEAKPGTLEAAKRWCILLAVYTGARIGEVTQLRRQDVTANALGELTLRITPEAGTVKGGEYRDVPLHSRLVELGFATFLESASEGPLFYPEGERRKKNAKTPQSELVARDLAEWSRFNGLGDPLLSRPLHALRHRFNTEAHRAGIEEKYVVAIAGWSPGANMARRYGSQPVEVLRRELEKLRPERMEGRAE